MYNKAIHWVQAMNITEHNAITEVVCVMGEEWGGEGEGSEYSSSIRLRPK